MQLSHIFEIPSISKKNPSISNEEPGILIGNLQKSRHSKSNIFKMLHFLQFEFELMGTSNKIPRTLTMVRNLGF